MVHSENESIVLIKVSQTRNPPFHKVLVNNYCMIILIIYICHSQYLFLG